MHITKLPDKMATDKLTDRQQRLVNNGCLALRNNLHKNNPVISRIITH